VIAPTRYGIDCGERTAAIVEAALRWYATEVGESVVIIAHSRGGQFARATAVRAPEHVRALITLGSPLNRLLAVRPRLRARCALLGIAGTAGVPGVMRAGCLWGSCCRRLRSDLAAPFPDALPFVSIYSRQDEVVDWRASIDPAARHREVTATHSGLINTAESIRALSDELIAVTNATTHSTLPAPAGVTRIDDLTTRKAG
jgi:pimeloyl-ACP methyl ester carboxylesterase